MAPRPQPAAFELDDEGLNLGKAWRCAVWAAAAVAAITTAGVAAYTGTGARRNGHAEVARQPSLDTELEARRLAEQVRLLAADRDRLQVRVSALERTLGDVTGSVAARPGLPPSSAPPMLAPGPALPPIDVPSLNAPAPPAPRPAPSANQPPSAADAVHRPGATVVPDPGPTGSTVTKTEFGVELGGAASVDGLRSLWTSIRGGNASLLDGLRPVMVIRDGAKAGAFELRLVAGPLNDAVAAARLCAALSAAGLSCQPTVFDGQRLALK